MKVIDSVMYASWAKDEKQLTDFATCWANLMEERISMGEEIIDMATVTCQIASRKHDGHLHKFFMVMILLVNSWKYGQELVPWCHKYYFHCMKNNPIIEMNR